MIATRMSTQVAIYEEKTMNDEIKLSLYHCIHTYSDMDNGRWFIHLDDAIEYMRRKHKTTRRETVNLLEQLGFVSKTMRSEYTHTVVRVWAWPTGMRDRLAEYTGDELTNDKRQTTYDNTKNLVRYGYMMSGLKR